MFCDYSTFVYWVETNGFLLKTMNERFTAAGLRCRQNLVYENFTFHLTDYVKNCIKKHAARAARLFLLLQVSNHWFVVLLSIPLLHLRMAFVLMLASLVKTRLWDRPRIPLTQMLLYLKLSLPNDCKIQEIQAFLFILLRTLMMYELKKWSSHLLDKMWPAHTWVPS